MLPIPIKHADDVNKLIVIPQVVVSLANPKSPECIHNSAVHFEAF